MAKSHIPLFLISILFVVSCTPYNPNESNNQSSVPSLPYIVKHFYNELSSNYINWSDTFNSYSVCYYVFYHSKTCSHCLEIQTQIVEYGLAHKSNFFLVEESNEFVFLNNIDQTIGCKNFKDFGILGIPTLVKIENGIVTKNEAGKSNIFKELNIL